MIFKISWRNIWRSPTRSFVVMGAIVVGIWSVVFLFGMMNGMMDTYVQNAIKNEVSHIQIHQPDFLKDKESKYFIADGQSVLDKCKDIEGIEAATTRSLTNAMIASSKSTKGIRVSGIEPELEKQVTGIASEIVEGEYLSEKKKNPILVSAKTAEKLNLKLHSKVVLTFQNLNGDITAAAFRVIGLFDSGNNMYDETISFVRQKDLNELLGRENIAHEVALIVDDLANIDRIKAALTADFPELSVQSYREIAPELELFQSNMKMASVLYMVIFMLALIFGIINTMLMTVLERFKEIGMLMAVGMNKLKVFSMIVVETLMLAIISAPIGLLLSYLTVEYFHKNGFNIFFFPEDGMKQFGMSNFVYFTVPSDLYWQLAFAVSLTALLASLYPAWKAIRLKPVDAIRKI